ncbi:hypothetical protein RUMHYD_01513 [Blautia hydrogenotrophica DSM 10507]|uniref:Uncharacterized protein n=1 Tax=Blautia hydrogenotrophica (strain DSM 10507 / JCM 14656 / S5a33) TaxID=476272 RepID=C0CKZ4_BLAHS|nr:hypothetical protein RUMHYD_01513 [Blautia hydrogenotrophica DSM 10507]
MVMVTTGFAMIISFIYWCIFLDLSNRNKFYYNMIGKIMQEKGRTFFVGML